MNIAFNDPSSISFDQAIDRRTRESRPLTQRKRGGGAKSQEGERGNWCVIVWCSASTCQDANKVRKNPRQLQYCL